MTIADFIAEIEKIETEDHPKDIENKEKKCRACGQVWSVTIQCSGCLKYIISLCHDYRLCDNCRHQKWLSELEVRLRYAHNHLPLGNWLKWRKIHDIDKEAFQKKIKRHKGQFYAFPQPNHMNLIIHNALDLEGEDLLDFDEFEGEDVNFKQVLSDVPEGRRISGRLGQKSIVVQEDGEGETEEEIEEEYEVIQIPSLFSPTATRRDYSLAYDKATVDTQNIKVDSPKELSRAMFKRLNAMAEYLPDDAFVYYDFIGISQSQVAEWNLNPNNGVNVQAIDIGESNISKADKKPLEGIEQFLAEVGDIALERHYRASVSG